MKLKLLVINDTPKFHLRSLGSVNFIDAWQVHKFFVKLTENCQNQVCKHKFTTRISYSVPRGNSYLQSTNKVIFSITELKPLHNGPYHAEIARFCYFFNKPLPDLFLCHHPTIFKKQGRIIK